MSVEMIDLLELIVAEEGSDLHIEVGVSPTIRLHGALVPLDSPELTPDDTERLIRSITSDYHQKMIREIGTVDFGFDFNGKARFRVSAFKQKGVYGAVLRLIPNELLSLEDIGIPIAVKDLLYKPRGLILITGPTGSGKSTTLASMIDVINRERDAHIITIEDPIEFYHKHKKSLIIQREVGVDVPAFDEALRRALRQDPDVILVGELRDLDTMRAAITAAETGHLVFATLHTIGAARTVDRMIDAFPENQQAQIRTQLASSLIAVVSQVLLKRSDRNGRVAAFEIMLSVPAVQALIRENKTYLITSVIQTGAKWGMNTLDNHLMELYTKKIISYTDLLTKAQDSDFIVKKLKDGL
ncbi:MAG: type IV pilus twitching motility protein PilT [bacterium]|nr:type IV pilus twitching motility protein PilT [bacterium]